MAHDTTSLLATAVALVLGALVLVTVCVRLRLPAIFGYLLTGMVLGPQGAALALDRANLALLADLGVVFLMFTVGLQFSLNRIWEIRHAIFGVGLMQVALVTTATALLCLAGTNLSPIAALLVGGALAMSSTALTVKQLADQDELMMRHGRLAVAILLFQDIATVPFLLLIGFAASEAALSASETWWRVVAGVAAFAFVTLAIRALWRPATAWLANQHSTELLQLAALSLALGAAFVAHEAGLPAAIGAFLAGLSVGDSEHKHHVERQLQPFRDLLVGVFFISVGVQLNAAMSFANIAGAAVLAAAIVVAKAILIFCTLFVFRQALETSLRVSAVLAHGGEFSWLLLGLAAATSVVPSTVSQPLFLAVGLTMFLAPLLIRFNGALGRLLRGATDQDAEEPRR